MINEVEGWRYCDSLPSVIHYPADYVSISLYAVNRSSHNFLFSWFRLFVLLHPFLQCHDDVTGKTCRAPRRVLSLLRFSRRSFNCRAADRLCQAVRHLLKDSERRPTELDDRDQLVYVCVDWLFWTYTAFFSATASL